MSGAAGVAAIVIACGAIGINSIPLAIIALTLTLVSMYADHVEWRDRK